MKQKNIKKVIKNFIKKNEKVTLKNILIHCFKLNYGLTEIIYSINELLYQEKIEYISEQIIN